LARAALAAFPQACTLAQTARFATKLVMACDNSVWFYGFFTTFLVSLLAKSSGA
jgi:hypothetical protein